jgi:hypothetical protein
MFCTSLNSITIPGKLKTLPNLQFQGCSSLQTVFFDEGVTRLGYNVFDGCTSLTYVSFPTTLTKTGTSMFNDCKSLASITLPPHLSAIEDWTFYNCSSLVSITIPSEATYIRSYAFYGCSSLTSLSLPASINDLRYDAFAGCRAMITMAQNNPYYTSSNGILFDKKKTFLIHFPSMRTDTSYTIPSTVTRLEYSAFDTCTTFKTLIIPSNVLSFDGNEFPNCSGLKSIYAKNKTPITCPSNIFFDDMFYNVDTNNCVLYVPKGSKVLYEVANQWEKFVHIVEYDILSVSSNTVSLTNGASNTDTISVTTDSVWTASCSEQWLTISPQTATSGNGIITFNTTANTTALPRTATVEVTTNGASELITITQAAGIVPLTLAVSTDTASLAKETGSTNSINITSNTTWTAISNQTWLTVNPNTTDSGNATLILTATANQTPAVRTATVTISAGGVSSKTVTVTQEAGAVTFISEITSEKAAIYPNPTKNDFFVHSNEKTLVTIYSINGLLIKSEEVDSNGKITTNNIEAGIYIVEIKHNNRIQSQRLIINK